MLKVSSPRLQTCICKLLNIILTNEKYPSQWRENLLKPIHKKGSDTDPRNYRGIVISSCLSKLFSRILHNRIEKHITDNDIMNENQTGFRKGYRTSDHILTLKSIIEKQFKKGAYLYTCFVDFEKAFDTVWRNALFQTGFIRVRELSGKFKIFKGQGIVREFHNLSGKIEFLLKCQGNVREF